MLLFGDTSFVARNDLVASLDYDSAESLRSDGFAQPMKAIGGSPYLDATLVASYERLSVPLQFAAPARDLVAALQVSTGDRVLDVGTGTGAALIQAAPHAGLIGIAVGVDPSIEMLRALRQKCGLPLVLAQAPGLPFPKDSFDAVMASFVLSHSEDCEETLADMMRVLRPHRRLGVTSWGSNPNPVSKVWTDVAARFVNTEELKVAFRKMIPWDEWFSQAANLQQALEQAKLVGVQVFRREYAMRMSVEDCLSLRGGNVEGTLLRRQLQPAQREEFNQQFADALRTRFGETVEYPRDVYIGIGTKPFS